MKENGYGEEDRMTICLCVVIYERNGIMESLW